MDIGELIIWMRAFWGKCINNPKTYSQVEEMGMSAENPKIAIYMPCYNHEKYVAEAIESILNQSYKNWELFIANDGSTDKTGEIIETYQDSRIHYYDLKENTKMVGAVNMMLNDIEPMSFDYIAETASDDVWKLDKLEKQVAILKKNDRYKACFTWDKVIFEEESMPYNGEYSHVKNKSRYDWVFDLIVNGNSLNTCSAIIDKEVFFQLGTLNESFIQLGDQRMWIMLTMNYPIYLINEELTVYRRHAGNLSNVNLAIVRSFNESYKIFDDFFKSIDRDNFRRIFYRKLIYKEIHSDEEFAAAKFCMLYDCFSSYTSSVAMNLYWDWCGNLEFIRVLEEDYGFTREMFYKFTGNRGMIYAANNICNNMILSQEKLQRVFNIDTIYNRITETSMNRTKLKKYMHSVFSFLYCLEDDEDIDTWIGLKMCINAAQNEYINSIEHKKVLYIVSIDTQWFPRKEEMPYPPNTDTDVFWSYVKPIETIEDIEVAKDTIEVFEKIGINYIDLYDHKNDCLKIPDEELEGVDIICYVDCLSEEYECLNIAYAVSLASKQIAILEKKVCEVIKEKNPRINELLSGIYTYEGAYE